MPQQSPSNARSRLAALGEKTAVTKAAQLRMLWPEISAALANGHTLKSVCDCLEADGLKMSARSLGVYVTRMRRNSAQAVLLTPSITTPGPVQDAGGDLPARNNGIKKTSMADQNRGNPLANVRKSQTKQPAFDYRPELADPDKLI